MSLKDGGPDKVMHTLEVRQNQVEYAGIFARPAVSLWGEGKTLLDGLLNAFEGYHSGLNSFRTLGEPDAPASQGIAVSVGQQCTYRFKFERVEASLFNFGDADLDLLAEILGKGDLWVRSAVPGLTYSSHLFTYASHYALSEGTAKAYLKGVSALHVLEDGQNLGSGIIFHADLPDRNWRIQLVVDHSLSVTDGLFVQMFVVVAGDIVNYAEAFSSGRTILNSSLERLGLRFGEAG